MMMEPRGWDGHLLLVHSSERQRCAGVAAWVRRGLDVGAKILYIEPADEPAERSLIHVLRQSAIDVDEALDRGQLQLLPADAHAHVERATDEFCRTGPVSFLCQYSATLGPAALQTACGMHGAGVREPLFRTSPVPGGIALEGEVDVSNEADLRSCLMAAAAQMGGARFVVDLSRLRFLDVAAVRTLLTATSAHRTNGGSVLLRGAQPPVDRMLTLLEIDQVPGCIVERRR